MNGTVAKRSREWMRPLLIVAACCVVGSTMAGCKRKPAVGGAHNPMAIGVVRQAESASVEALTMAAEAGVKSTSASDPKIRTPLPIRVHAYPYPPAAEPVAASSAPTTGRGATEPILFEQVRGTYAMEAEADEDALVEASKRVGQLLASLDPPIPLTPTIDQVKAEFIRKGSRKVVEPNAEQRRLYESNGLPGPRVWVQYDVAVTNAQVRELRSEERVLLSSRLFVGIAICSLALFLFLRIDESTKGYLTSWLALAGMALAGGTAALLLLI